jgi:5-methylthioadenosine/S-adenosylhomocysteine deaminase
VTDVWVAGKRLLKQRELTSIDLNEIQQRVQHWQQRLTHE